MSSRWVSSWLLFIAKPQDKNHISDSVKWRGSFVLQTHSRRAFQRRGLSSVSSGACVFSHQRTYDCIHSIIEHDKLKDKVDLAAFNTENMNINFAIRFFCREVVQVQGLG